MEKEMKVLNNQNLEEKEADFHDIRIVEGESNWLTLMERKRKQKPRLLRKSAGNISCCLFRVPQSLVEINEKAYQPHTVSIGPYHHGKDHLKMIQEHKWRLLDTLIARTENQVGKKVQNDPKDPIFNMLWVFPFLMRDLLRLENQIPFFVLQTLFDMYMTSLDKEGPSLAQLALDSFDYIIERPTEVLQRYYNVKAVHLLDLFRLSFIPQSKGSNEKNYLHDGMKDFVSTTIPSAQRLHVAAFEQCYSDCSKHITSYTTFMSCLISKPSDVGFLSDQNVIENDFGTDKEVVRFFSNISKDVPFDFRLSYLFKLFEDVNEHCRNKWHVRWADIKYTYFNTPWSSISALAASLLLVLTMIQAFFAIYAYVLAPSPH
ncbi:hypothetical protein SO802_019118 [Lithocarpus litseifolius]|uniref:Uncharacterized protein n=1 Tax=Lithocarpus litseifolius TaxID=425828 RepID=A0AAW2CMV0_9ROSI